MNKTIEQFLTKVILKRNEQIGSVSERDGLYEVTIVIHSPRIYRKVAQITIAQQVSLNETIPPEVKKHRFTIRAKRRLTEQDKTIFAWLQSGWILREMRFNQDGLTVEDVFYRRGPTYHRVETKKKQQQDEAYENEFQQVMAQANSLMMPKEFAQVLTPESMPQAWNQDKKLHFIHFCIAFYQLSLEKDLFDFKEIGATYERRIGGSKLFDTYRDDFLTHLKESAIDVELYGLVSIGSIVPIFFTGNGQSKWATYELGAVHATTDDTVLKSTFTTNNKRLWLVENRAILTRMALEVDFLQETSSFVLCLDGQIKSAHKRFIKQLLNSRIEQAYVWTDYDAAGVTIAKHAVELLSCPYKIIGRDGQRFTTIEQYEQSVLTEGEHEQEQQLGGVTQWIKWI